jgi:hypothetical protein
MGIRHHEQDIGLPSKWVFSFSTRGYAQLLLIICVVVKNKIKRTLCVQVKNKPCVIYTVMRLIPWIQSRASKTIVA